jgi:hypothetical protein
MNTNQKCCKLQMKKLLDLNYEKISWRIVQNAIRSQVIMDQIFTGNDAMTMVIETETNVLFQKKLLYLHEIAISCQC